MSLSLKPEAPWISADAPAKLNLRLKVPGRRSDGYHILSMINVPLALSDTVRVRWSSSAQDSCLCNGPFGSQSGAPQENTVLRLAREFRTHTGDFRPVEFLLDKYIPAQAGLGGGSSDAATALQLLEKLFQRRLSTVERLHLAAKVGSDVPYLLKPEPALVQGVGEKVRVLSMEWLQGWPCMLIVPPFGLSTSEVYARFDSAFGEWCDSDPFLDFLSGDSAYHQAAPWFEQWIENDLLKAACSLAPQLGDILLAAKTVAELRTGLTGSGSALFSVPLARGPDIEHYFNLVRERVAPFGAQCLRTQVNWSVGTR